jgi:acyl carrier protein
MRRMTDREMAELWEEILDVDDIGADDHFFEVGGNSLLAVDVVAAVNARTGAIISLGQFFADPTPRAVAAAISRGVSR